MCLIREGCFLCSPRGRMEFNTAQRGLSSTVVRYRPLREDPACRSPRTINAGPTRSSAPYTETTRGSLPGKPSTASGGIGRSPPSQRFSSERSYWSWAGDNVNDPLFGVIISVTGFLIMVGVATVLIGYPTSGQPHGVSDPGSGKQPGHRSCTPLPSCFGAGRAPGNARLIVARQVFTGRPPGVGFSINCWSPQSAGMTVWSASSAPLQPRN